MATVSLKKGSIKFKDFTRGCQALLCHGNGRVDFQTLTAWFKRNNFPDDIFQSMEQVNTSRTLCHHMWKENGCHKSEMRSIVDKYSIQALQDYYMGGNHNALMDAKSLCSLVTARGMFHRFFGSHALYVLF